MASGRYMNCALRIGALLAGAVTLAVLAILSFALESVPRRYRIECGTLEIEKGAELTVVTLSEGVVLNSRDGMRVESATGLIKVVSRVVEEGMKLGEHAAAEETESIDTKLKPPPETLKQPSNRMSELQPAASASITQTPRIAPEDIKYMELAGGVRLTSKDGILTCDAVYSEDGGRTFKTRGKADFKGTGGNSGMQFAADSLTFNGAQSILSGAGGVRIVLPQNGGRADGAVAGSGGRRGSGVGGAGGAPSGSATSGKPGGNITVTAGSFKYDIRSDLLTLRGAPAVALDDVRLTAGALVYNGKTGQVDAKGGVTATFKEKGVTAVADTAVYTPEGLVTFAGGVRIVQSANGNTLTCDRLEYRDSTGDVKASGARDPDAGAGVGGAGGAPSGGVRLTIPRENLTLVCGEIDGNIENESGTARGDPMLTRGDSSVKGEELRFHRESDRIVVEVLGQDKTEYVLAPDAFDEAGR